MNSLTFRLLEVFRHVVDSGSVTAASSSLSLSQPTVSLQLKKLSAIIGLPLLEQVHGQIKMTEAGQALYTCSQEVLGSQEKLNSQIQAIKGMETGTLKLAVVTTAQYVLPPLLSPFCQAHPNIEVRFTVANRNQIIERLHHNMDDLYIFSQPPEDASIHSSPFMENRLVVIAPASYQGPDHCRLSDLLDQKFLLREAGSGTHKTLQAYCERRQLRFTNAMTIESNEAIRLAVASGLGLAIVSEHTLGPQPCDRIKQLAVEDFPLTNYWQVVTVGHRPVSLAALAFRDSILAEAHSLPATS